MNPRPSRSAIALVAAVVLALSACGTSGDDTGGAAQTTEAPTRMSAAKLDRAVERHVQKVRRADQRLADCERSVAGYGFNNCWKRTSRTFDRAGDLLTLLHEQGGPPAYGQLLSELQRFVIVQPEVRKGCRTGNDQTCDTALMKYRTELQDVLWAAP